MDAVGELGGLRLDHQRAVDDVYNGYTYFCDGDVVVAKITPCFENGKGALAEGLTNGVAFGTTELHVVRACPALDGRFLFYITIAHDFRSFGAAEMLGAGGQKRVPERFLKDWMASIPPLEIQKRIAAVLDEKTARIDALIEKKRSLLDRLAEKRQAIITQAVTKGLNPAAPMKDSGIDWLGQIPAHWDVRRLRYSISTIEQGWSPQCDSRPADLDEWGVLKVGCVNGDQYDEKENKALPSDLEPAKQYEVRKGDILISRANTRELLGSAALVNRTQGKILLCDKLYRINVIRELYAEYLIGVLRSPISRLQYERSSNGTSGSMQNIGQDTILNLIHPFPPLEEQKQIVNWFQTRTMNLDDVRIDVVGSLERLSEYRSALITAAVTGHIEGLR
jgi:type I restriction enzyme S subunit